MAAQIAALFAVLLCVWSAAAAAQRGDAGDSARVRGAARQAVARFERTRMTHLPRGVGSATAATPCPTRVGGMCHWPEDEDAPDPPAEDPAVGAARDGAIALLDSARRLEPADPWLIGEQVRLDVEGGRTADAVAAARGCTAQPIWCAELAGYAFHAAQQYAAADSAFDVALREMPTPGRCKWEDLGALLEGRLADRFARGDCAARERMGHRIWWLASPLYLVSEVDARTAYYSRLVRARIADLEPTGEPFGWNDDVRAVALRYGWPLWYSQDPPAPGAITAPAVVGHERSDAYYFFPTVRALDSLGVSDASDWALSESHAPAAYAPAYLRSLHTLDVSVARFRRADDSTLIVVAWDASADTALRSAGLRAGLFVARDPDSTLSKQLRDAKPRGALAVTTGAREALVSVELLNGSTHRAARARFGVRALEASGFGLSDLLLFTPSTELPAHLDDAAARAIASAADTRVVGLYWEVYTPGDTAASIHMHLRIAPVRRSWLGRVVARFRSGASALALQWDEPLSAAGRTSRALRVDLSGLRPGLYRMELEATDAARHRTQSASRDMVLPGGA